MRVGLLLGGLDDARSLGASAKEAEDLGFDSLWAGDHIQFPAPILDPLLVLSCYAAHTRRVQLGTCVYLLALRHPTPVAKMVASLDFLSAGRMVFGVGVGGEFPGEFRACEVPRSERGPRTDEAIRLLRRIWKRAEAGERGRFYDVGNVRLDPAPVQPTGPPIWIGGRSEAALRRTAHFGDGYVGYLLSAEGFSSRMVRIRELAEAAKRTESITGAMMAFALVHSRRDQAEKRASSILGAMYGRPMESAVSRFCVVGTEEECRATVQRYRDAGVEHLILSPLAYGAGLSDQLRSLATAVAQR